MAICDGAHRAGGHRYRHLDAFTRYLAEQANGILAAMITTNPYILPSDVVLTPVTDLSHDLRKQFRADEGDVAITRPRSRTPSKIVDAQLAALIRQFREPKTIVEAVIDYSRQNQLDPERTLEEAFPVLASFINAHILLPLGSEDAVRIVASYDAGEVIAGLTVVRCIQIIEDSELYKVETSNGQLAALKIARPGHIEALEWALEREANVLRQLDGVANPTLFDSGIFRDRPYLVTAWCPGVTAHSAAYGLRQVSGFGAQRWGPLRDFCVAICDAYAHLHQQGLIHGDVHPRNVLIDPGGAIKIIDFGLARFDDIESQPHKLRRGGIGFFFEPEFARARLARRKVPRSTFMGEQYSLAAMIYMLISGGHYMDFSAEKHEMMRQIAEDPTMPFDRHGEAWPSLEAVLAQALRKKSIGTLRVGRRVGARASRYRPAWMLIRSCGDHSTFAVRYFCGSGIGPGGNRAF